MFLRSPPTARVGRHGERQRRPAAGRSRGSGGAAAPRRRPRGRPSRRTGTWIGRSWPQPARRRARASRARASASSVAIGSPPRLPLVITSAPGRASPGSPSSRWWSGRVGQQQAQVRVARRHATARAGGPRAGAAAARWAGAGPVSSAPASGVDVGERAGGGEVADHHRERLVAPPLARAQRRDRALVGRVAGQVVAAEPLDRDDPARGEQRRARAGERGVAGAVAPSPAGDQPQPRPAGRAGDRLGVEAPVGRVGVLRRRTRRTSGSRPSWWPAGRRAASVMIVKRGPQLVQVMNGWRYRRSAGSDSSRQAVVAGGRVGGDEGAAGPPSAGSRRS